MTNIGPFLGQDAAVYSDVRFGTFLRQCANYPTCQQTARMIAKSLDDNAFGDHIGAGEISD